MCLRILHGGEHGPLSKSTFPLPALRPPTDGLVALLDVPSVAKLHVPLSLTLTIRNRHSARSANITVQLEPDPSDSFVVAGLRSGRVPILMPGAEEKLLWRLIPIECGLVKVPRIKIMDKRKAIASAQGIRGPDAEVEIEGDIVKVVDVRMDQRAPRSAEDSESHPQPNGTILVLP